MKKILLKCPNCKEIREIDFDFRHKTSCIECGVKMIPMVKNVWKEQVAALPENYMTKDDLN